MKAIAEYSGKLLNHIEGLYRPGEKELAVELIDALGMAVVEIDIGKGLKPLVSVHPNGDDRDTTNNVMFLAEMSPAAVELDDLLQKNIAANPDLNEAMHAYKEKARTRPGGIPHFGLRYPSTEALQPVLEKLKSGLTPELSERVTVTEAPPFAPIAGFPDIRQVFVYTDVFAAGPAAYGQLIELQVVRGT